MSAQVAQLQQTVQMSIMDKSLNLATTSTVEMLEQMTEQTNANHPYKGTVIDISL